MQFQNEKLACPWHTLYWVNDLSVCGQHSETAFTHIYTKTYHYFQFDVQLTWYVPQCSKNANNKGNEIYCEYATGHPTRLGPASLAWVGPSMFATVFSFDIIMRLCRRAGPVTTLQMPLQCTRQTSKSLDARICSNSGLWLAKTKQLLPGS